MPIFKFKRISYILPSVLVPFANIKEASVVCRDSFLNGFSNFKQYINIRKIKETDFYQVNLNLAQFHLNNGNIFDAKLRYKIAHLFNKSQTAPIIGLAEIALLKKNNKKARNLLKKALSICSEAHEKTKIESLIEQIK